MTNTDPLELQSHLRKGHCVPCEGTEAPLTNEIEDQYLSAAPEWKLDRADIHKLNREFEFKNFKEVLAFVNKVGEIAESEGHHPNLYIHEYKNLRIELYTHAIKGLSMNDFILAVKIDELLKSAA